jgi:hypothetical protein
VQHQALGCERPIKHHRYMSEDGLSRRAIC